MPVKLKLKNGSEATERPPSSTETRNGRLDVPATTRGRAEVNGRLETRTKAAKSLVRPSKNQGS
jgi:hypothetical protein